MCVRVQCQRLPACFQGRAQFLRIQKFAALVFAVVQSVGQLSYIRPFVTDFSPFWLADSVATLTAGAMILVWVSVRSVWKSIWAFILVIVLCWGGSCIMLPSTRSVKFCINTVSQDHAVCSASAVFMLSRASDDDFVQCGMSFEVLAVRKGR